MPPIKRKIVKRKTKKSVIKRPEIKMEPLNPKDIPQHLLDKMPSGMKMNMNMKDLRNIAMNSRYRCLAPTYIPQILTPQQQQLNTLRDNNDSKERMINDVARSLENERERQKELKKKEAENKLMNQEQEHKLKLQELDVKNQLEDNKQKNQIEAKQRDLEYQQSKLNSSNEAAQLQIQYNDKLNELNDAKIENQKLLAKTQNNVMLSNIKKTQGEVKYLFTENEALRKSLAELQDESYLDKFAEEVKQQQELMFEKELLQSMLEQARKNNKLKLEQQLQPDENLIKALNDKYENRINDLRNETIELENKYSNVKEMKDKIDRNKQILRDVEADNLRADYQLECLKRTVENTNTDEINAETLKLIKQYVEKEKEINIQNQLKDLKDKINKEQINIETSKKTQEAITSGINYNQSIEIALQAAKYEELKKIQEAKEKENENLKLENKLKAEYEVANFINSIENSNELMPKIDEALANLKNNQDSLNMYIYNAMKDKQLRMQMERFNVGQKAEEIKQYFENISQDSHVLKMLEEYDAENGIDGHEIIANGHPLVKLKYYNDFNRKYGFNPNDDSFLT